MDRDETTPRRRARRRAAGDRGAAVVEAALTFPLIVMLIFGMFSGGMALSQKNSIENAAREASRLGATSEVVDTSNTKPWLDNVSDAAISAATGELSADSPGQYVCVALVGTSNGTDGRKIISGGVVTYDTGPCPVAPGTTSTEVMSCPVGRPCVHVKLQRDAVLDVVLARHEMRLDASSVTIYERN